MKLNIRPYYSGKSVIYNSHNPTTTFSVLAPRTTVDYQWCKPTGQLHCTQNLRKREMKSAYDLLVWSNYTLGVATMTARITCPMEDPTNLLLKLLVGRGHAGNLPHIEVNQSSIDEPCGPLQG